MTATPFLDSGGSRRPAEAPAGTSVPPEATSPEPAPAGSRSGATWWDRAACRGLDPEIFHADGRGDEADRAREAAKAICTSCPVQPDCASYALAAHEPHGVWGGFTATHRRRIIARARRALGELHPWKGARMPAEAPTPADIDVFVDLILDRGHLVHPDGRGGICGIGDPGSLDASWKAALVQLGPWLAPHLVDEPRLIGATLLFLGYSEWAVRWLMDKGHSEAVIRATAESHGFEHVEDDHPFGRDGVLEVWGNLPREAE